MGKVLYPVLKPDFLNRYRDIEPGNRAEIRRYIRDNWKKIQLYAMGSGFRGVLPKLPSQDSSINLLGSSTKILKGNKYKVLTRIFYGSPARESGRDLCPNRSPMCTAGCLGTGCWHLAIPSGLNSKRWKSMLLLGDPDRFIRLMILEMDAHLRSADRKKMDAAIRLDGTTDLGLSDTLAGFDRFETLDAYDYTKSMGRMMRFVDGKMPSNRTLTFSRSENNHRNCLKVLENGGTVAVPIACKPDRFPDSWLGFPVENGDRHDIRSWDTPGSWQFLSWKGKHSKDRAIEKGFCLPCPN